jgi:hypothetical protein
MFHFDLLQDVVWVQDLGLEADFEGVLNSKVKGNGGRKHGMRMQMPIYSQSHKYQVTCPRIEPSNHRNSLESLEK